MRRSLVLFVFAATIAATTPAQAQLRTDATALQQGESVRLTDSGVTLSTLFSPGVFQMSHSYEMSAGSFGGVGYSMGMYTNTMQWQFSSQLAARLDLAMAQPFSGADVLGLNRDGGPQVFVRNAEVAYRPSDSVLLNFSYRQSPFGGYAAPGYGRVGLMNGYDAGARSAERLFWRGTN
jgi:hypothetical protein